MVRDSLYSHSSEENNDENKICNTKTNRKFKKISQIYLFFVYTEISYASDQHPFHKKRPTMQVKAVFILVSQMKQRKVMRMPR